MKTLSRGFLGFCVLAFALTGRAAVKEPEFQQVLDKLAAIYLPIIKAKTGAFTIVKNWGDNTINAYAQKWPDRFIVTVLGGIGRHKETTPDGLAAITCHEIGFLMGGEPRSVSPGEWASVIGQADYYATAKCMKKYLADEDNIEFLRGKKVPAVVTSKCAQAYSTAGDRALCVRSSLAGIAVGNLLAALKGEKVDVETPAPEKASETMKYHPSAQCRLDTFIAGALCNVDPDDENYCATGTLGGRPQCWFAN